MCWALCATLTLPPTLTGSSRCCWRAFVLPARLAARAAAEQTLLDFGVWEPWGDRAAQAARTPTLTPDLALHGQNASVLRVPPGCPAARRRCERQVALLTVIVHVTDRMSASLNLLGFSLQSNAEMSTGHKVLAAKARARHCPASHGQHCAATRSQYVCEGCRRAASTLRALS